MPIAVFWLLFSSFFRSSQFESVGSGHRRSAASALSLSLFFPFLSGMKKFPRDLPALCRSSSSLGFPQQKIGESVDKTIVILYAYIICVRSSIGRFSMLCKAPEGMDRSLRYAQHPYTQSTTHRIVFIVVVRLCKRFGVTFRKFPNSKRCYINNNKS